MFQWCFGGSFHFYTFFLFLFIHYFLVYASFLCFPSVYICLLCRYYIILCYYCITIRYCYFIATIRYCTVLLLHVTISFNYYICYYIYVLRHIFLHFLLCITDILLSLQGCMDMCICTHTYIHTSKDTHNHDNNGIM